MSEKVSSQFNYPSHYQEINGAKIHYIEAGKGNPIVFLHGIPTSNYLWRNIIPFLSPLGRCIAPDLIGCGKSAKPDIDYTVRDHIKYIDDFIESMQLKNIILIMHGWGSVIGLDYAMRHEKNCKGLVFYEPFFPQVNGDNISLPLQEQLAIAQEPAVFLDAFFSQSSIRPLTKEAIDYYRQPFLQKGTHKPIAQYLNELPHSSDANVTDVDKLIAQYSEKLQKSSLPKLMLYSIPGFITAIATVLWAKEKIPNLEVIELGEEMHLAQESCPAFIGEAISVWLQGVEQREKTS